MGWISDAILLGLRPGRQLLRGMLAVVRRLLVAEPALVPRRAHLLLVAKPLQVLGRDVDPRRFRRGRWWMWGFGGHEAIVSVLGGELRPGTCAAAVLSWGVVQC